MEWLEAGLAFAVIMMVFSTMVSVIVESGHRVFRHREQGLQRIVEDLFDDTLWPKFSSRLLAASGPVDPSTKKKEIRQGFVEIMTNSPFNPNTKQGALLPKITNASKQKQLTSLELIERLAETDVGLQILEIGHKKGKHYLNILIKDCISKFEDIGENASEYFARRARLVSIVVSVLLAFAIHIDAVQLFKYFLSSRPARMAMIAQGEAVAKELKAQEKRLEALTKQEVVDQKRNIAELSSNIKELNSSFDTLKSEGVPIGWDERPWKKDAKVWSKLEPGWRLAYGLGWFCSVLLAGVLIGLGGPFWFDTFRKLSSLTDVVRGLISDTQKTKEKPPGRPGMPDEDSGVNPVEVFLNAAAAKSFEAPVGRTLLNPDGSAYERR